jgi:hypothetical protein
MSNLGDITEGPTGVNPCRVAIAASDTILVIDSDAGIGGDGSGPLRTGEDRVVPELLREIHKPPPVAGNLDGDLRWR